MIETKGIGMDPVRGPLWPLFQGTESAVVVENVSTDSQHDRCKQFVFTAPKLVQIHLKIAATDEKERGINMLFSRWQDAVSNAENKIKGREASYWKVIRKFCSCQELINGLERRKQAAEAGMQSMYSKARLYVCPYEIKTITVN